MTSVALLAVRGVSKRFPGVLALDNVSLDVLPGQVHALIGENGAGKSTLIKILTGVYRADAGEVRFGGEPIAFAQPLQAQRAGISTIYQEVNLVPLMSVARNLFLGREPRRFAWLPGLIDLHRMNRDAHAMLKRYGVDIDVTQPLRRLGMGAQQMVALARAVTIARQPDLDGTGYARPSATHAAHAEGARLLIMDEPTSSLEPREVETLFDTVRTLAAQGIAVIYVSHRLDELYQLCDEVTVLRDGRVVHSGPLTGMTKPQLISRMLGRELTGDGLTRFTHDHHVGKEPVLKASGLTKRHVLSDVGFDVRPGEVTGLGGLLGSGRSETAKAVIGALPLDSGTVTVDGKQIRLTTAAAIRAGLAMLPEDRKAEGIIPDLSVRENIVLAAMPRLSRTGIVTRRKQDQVVDTFMKRLRIKASSPEQRVGELSGGNQQKVLLARWLCLHPKVLLLDEPTRGIDVGAKAEVQALIDELARAGLAVVLISSDLEELVEGADRVVVLKSGAVVGEVTDPSEDDIVELMAHG